jgi:glycosyltransferase involved in cell wall biosynthesis
MRVMVLSNIFPPHVRGGYELGVLEVARTFAAAGHDVEVVTSTAVGAQRRVRRADDVATREVFAPVLAYEPDLADRLQDSAVWSHDRTDAFGGVIPANVVALAREIERFRPDRIWMGNPLGLGPVGIFETALSARVPVIVHLMDDVDRYLLGYRRPIHWLSRVARLKRGMTAVSCASHVRAMNSVVGEYGAHLVVPNGVDFAAFPTRAEPLLRGGGPLRLVYFGQVEPMKGIPQLIAGIDAFAASPGSMPFELDIIGPASTSYGAELAAEIASRHLDDRVRVVGRLEKSGLLARLAGYDAAVLLLKQDEPFAYASLEAPAAGLPVVITRGHAVADAYPSDYPLFVDDRDDAESVSSTLRWCASHEHDLPVIGRDLRAHLLRRCDTTTAVNPRYLEILEHARAADRPTDVDALLAGALTVEAHALSINA